MIALPVPQDVAQKIALENGEKPESFHVTLAYCGSVDELSDEAIAGALLAARVCAYDGQKLNGILGGLGRFNASPSSDGKDVVYANVDVPGLETFREYVVRQLQSVGCPPLSNHGFTPHVTLAYIPQGEKMPLDRIETTPIEFEGLLVALGDRQVIFPFASGNMVKREEMQASNFQFIELATLEFDKPFDGLVAGEFTDMHGRSVKITPADLSEIVANTNALIESTRSESGELAGLPIDEMQHNKGHASGWLMGVELAGNVLRIIPQWTELGRELISKKIQRYFSATVDLAKKVIYGGTLTNWPATRDNKTGRVLLRPIELSQLYEIQAETEETHPPQPIQEEQKMSEMTDEMKAVIQSTVTEAVAELAKNLVQPPAPEKKELDLSAFFNVGEMDEKAKEQRKAELTSYLEQRRQQFELEWRRELAQKAHESQIAELSAKLTGGTDEAPRGLRVANEELQKWLLRLEPDEAKFFADLMGRTQKEGFIEFSELGHGKDVQGTRELEAGTKAQLEKWVKAGNSVEEFFAMNADILGDKRAYNLSAFVGKE